MRLECSRCPVNKFFHWLLAPAVPFLRIKSAEGRTVTVSDEDYEAGRERLLRAGMLNVQKRFTDKGQGSKE